jgi:hypothetical protein
MLENRAVAVQNQVAAELKQKGLDEYAVMKDRTSYTLYFSDYLGGPSRMAVPFDTAKQFRNLRVKSMLDLMRPSSESRSTLLRTSIGLNMSLVQ